jgi:hypothetical protein
VTFESYFPKRNEFGEKKSKENQQKSSEKTKKKLVNKKMVVEYNLDVEEECPLCIELLNHDLNFFPCECGFQVILTLLGKETNKLSNSKRQNVFRFEF